MLASLEAFLMFIAYLAASLAMLALFVVLYLRVTPYDDIKDIHDGKQEYGQFYQDHDEHLGIGIYFDP